MPSINFLLEYLSRTHEALYIFFFSFFLYICINWERAINILDSFLYIKEKQYIAQHKKINSTCKNWTAMRRRCIRSTSNIIQTNGFIITSSNQITWCFMEIHRTDSAILHRRINTAMHTYISFIQCIPETTFTWPKIISNKSKKKIALMLNPYKPQ